MDEPLALKGELLDPGNMIFGLTSGGARTTVKIDQTPDFDRKT